MRKKMQREFALESFNAKAADGILGLERGEHPLADVDRDWILRAVVVDEPAAPKVDAMVRFRRDARDTCGTQAHDDHRAFTGVTKALGLAPRRDRDVSRTNLPYDRMPGARLREVDRARDMHTDQVVVDREDRVEITEVMKFEAHIVPASGATRQQGHGQCGRRWHCRRVVVMFHHVKPQRKRRRDMLIGGSASQCDFFCTPAQASRLTSRGVLGHAS